MKRIKLVLWASLLVLAGLWLLADADFHQELFQMR